MTAQVAMRFALGDALVALGAKYPDMVVLDSDVASSTRTIQFGKKYPDRFFNVGVAEGNMVDVAAGLATCGLRPVVSTFALFLTLKGGEQIRNIIAYNNLPVVLLGGYAGLSDSYDGASHQSVLDLAVMRAMPNIAVLAPADAVEIAQAVEIGLHRNGPTYIRVCRNPTPVLFADAPPMELGRMRKLRDGSDITMVVCGVPTFMALDAAAVLAGEGVEVDLLEASTLKPLDVEALAASAARTRRVMTIEEHTVIGGLGSAVAEALGRRLPTPIECIGIEDCFPESGDYMALLAKHGISTACIAARARAIIR